MPSHRRWVCEAAEQKQSRARKEAEQARAEAERQAAIAQAVNEFLNDDLLAAVAPEEQGKDVSMREVLDAASEAIEGKFKEEPLVEASIRTTLGLTYRSLGEYEQGEPHLERALHLRRSKLGDDHPHTLTSMNNMGVLLVSMGKYAEAEPYLREALERKRRVLGDDHPSTLISIHNMGGLLRDLERLEEAEALGAEAVRGAKATLAPSHPFRLAALSQHGHTLAAMERYAEGEAELLEAREGFVNTLGTEHKRTIKVIGFLVDLYDAWDKSDPGKGYDAKAAQWRAKLPGSDHPIEGSPETEAGGEEQNDGGGR